MLHNKEISVLIMRSMSEFYSLLKVVNNERIKDGNELTEKQLMTIIAMKKYEKIELKNLSKDMHVSTSSLCILLNKLVDSGYVTREENKQDRRNTFYAATEKGLNAVDKEMYKILEILTKKIEQLEDIDKQEIISALATYERIVAKLI